MFEEQLNKSVPFHREFLNCNILLYQLIAFINIEYQNDINFHVIYLFSILNGCHNLSHVCLETEFSSSSVLSS